MTTESNRKYWIDNIRWITVVLVLVYHVFYIYNAVGVFGAMGHFSEVQYQDAVEYVLYPWFMLLLFVLAGISARLALSKYSSREFFKARTLKLLVPSTIGLFVFQWMVGYFNTASAGVVDSIPNNFFIRWISFSFSGIGPLWFAQDLWAFSLILLILKAVDRKDRLFNLCSKAPVVLANLFFFAIWGMSQIYADPTASMFSGLLNLYRPLFYFIGFIWGYLVFSQDTVQRSLEQARIPLGVAAVAGIIAYTIIYFGQDYTAPAHLALPWVNFLETVVIFAILGWGKHSLDKTSPFASYMARSSFGLYIVHYLVVASCACVMLKSSTLPPLAIYAITLLATLLLSPALYELLRRIPVIRWCVFGIKGKK